MSRNYKVITFMEQRFKHPPLFHFKKSGACLSASATVEAAFVIPVFIYGVMTVLYLLQMVGTQIRVQEALYNEGRRLARYAYLEDCLEEAAQQGKSEETEKLSQAEKPEEQSLIQKGVTLALAQGMFLKELGSMYGERSHVVGGNAGFIMTGSKFCEGNRDIVLEVTYFIRNPFDIFGLAVRKFTQRATVTVWTGNDRCTGIDGEGSNAETNGAQKDQQKEYVYVTQHGEVYHQNRGCTYLQPSIRSISIESLPNQRNAYGGKYYACEKCGNGQNEVAYVTEYGTRYHLNRNCSQIKRNVMKVLLSDVEDMRGCSKCGGAK